MEAVKEKKRTVQSPSLSYPEVPKGELDPQYLDCLKNAEESKLEEEEEQDDGGGVEESSSGKGLIIPDAHKIFIDQWKKEPCMVCTMPLMKQNGMSRKGIHRMYQVPVMFPCCMKYAHISCIANSVWSLNSTGEIVCPVCTEPDNTPPVDILHGHLRKNIDEKDRKKEGEDRKTGWVKALFDLLVNKGEKKLVIHMRTKKDAKVAQDYIKNNPPTMDELVELEWPVRYIKKYVAPNFEKLLEIGFRMEHLVYFHTKNEIDDLVSHYQINWKTNLKKEMKNRYGPEECSLRRIRDIKLNARAMSLIGLHMHELIKMGLKKDMIQNFSHITLIDWVNLLFFSKQHIKILGLQSRDFSKNAGVLGRVGNWTVENIRIAMKLSRDEIVDLGLSNYAPVNSSSSPSRINNKTYQTIMYKGPQKSSLLHAGERRHQRGGRARKPRKYKARFDFDRK